MKVKDIMSTHLITCTLDNSIHQIAQKMKEYDIGFMPITNKQKIIGILTDRDIVIHMISNYEHDISKYIIKDIITIDENRTITQALDIMKDKKIKRLLITHDKKVTGVLSISDILALNEYEMECIKALKAMYTILNRHKEIEAEIDEFYL